MDTRFFMIWNCLICGFGLSVNGFFNNEAHIIIIGITMILGGCFIVTEVE